jgi:hypothetical protein
VHLRGYTHRADARGQAEVVRENARIPMRLVDARVHREALEAAKSAKPGELAPDDLVPILVQAGESLRLVATSEEVLRDHALGAQLQAAYGGAERKFTLTMGAFRKRYLNRRNRDLVRIKSKHLLFRDIRLTSTPH